ncbi:hypothetical protein GGR51DRAFT_559336 [Nemania sp. FL0031]|nr:hypothetical protein GGR51DRAFT_559336 [Nemania sp. FL0031]
MAQRQLEVGPCYCATGRQRYRVKPSVSIPWETPGSSPLPHALIDPAPDPDSDSDPDSPDDGLDNVPDNGTDDGPDPDLDVIMDTSDGNSLPVGQDDHVVPDSQDDQSSEDDTNDVMPAAMPATIPAIIPPPIATIGLTLTTNINSMQQFLNNILVNTDNNPAFANSLLDSPDDLSDVSELADDSDNNEDSEPNEDKVPEIAPFRLNLTALSQHYNIYAAAYGSAIHISRVRSCVDHSLPPRPDLILRPPVSKEALRVGGYLDHLKPHQMNHLIMADLGDEEILLLARDDGDVAAYYTSHIEAALERGAPGDDNPTIVKPFFHQNVGRSAWGLAVHKQSRLIAVGNNNHEVHVFAPALRNPTYTSPKSGLYGRDLFLQIRISPEGKLVGVPEAFRFNNIGHATSFFQQREHSYHLIVETGAQGNNIPNVAFSSNANGDAVEVLAIDISGKLWILSIWPTCETRHRCFASVYTVHQQAIGRRTSMSRVSYNLPRGWGVLVLPESSFLPTNTFQEALGLKPAEAVYASLFYSRYIGTSKALEHIKDNSTSHPWVRHGQTHKFRIAPHRQIEVASEWYDPKFDCKENWTADRDEAADKSPKHVHLSSHKREEAKNGTVLCADGSSVMRTYEMDIELMAAHPDNIGIMFENIIRQKKPLRAALPHIPFSPERFSNLLHVPALSLVVAGSQCGRVALITLTRPTNPNYSFRRGFKVETILPKRRDEDLRLRPICLLLGVAIGPIPVDMGDEGSSSWPLGERRYRIMLHYYDHRILSYEVYRNMMTSELFVI